MNHISRARLKTDSNFNLTYSLVIVIARVSQSERNSTINISITKLQCKMAKNLHVLASSICLKHCISANICNLNKKRKILINCIDTHFQNTMVRV